MTIKSSGLWCDLCGNPILLGDYWDCAVNGKKGHACEKCKVAYEKTSDAGPEPVEIEQKEVSFKDEK